MTAARSAGGVVVLARRRLRHRLGRRLAGRRPVRVLLVLAAVLTTVIGGGWIAADSSLVALRYVTVEGTSRLSAPQVLAAAHVRSGTSLVWLDPGAVARRVEALRPVASVQVTRHWPHGLVIAVTERRPAAVVADAAGGVLLDRTGVPFATTPSPPSGLVRVRLAAPVPGAGDSQARAAMQVLAELPMSVRRTVALVSARSATEVSVQLTGGQTVVWGSPSDGATKAAVLRRLWQRTGGQANLIDVSTPDVAVTH